MENRLLTVVFIDMQGYTRRSAGQTIDEMKLFHDQMFSFVSEIMLKWNGIMVKTLGDGFMVRFDSPTNAIQAGIEVQRRLESRNAQMMTPDSIVRFRIGINTGEVGIDENGDLFGDPVNIASRIQTFADPNDVFISESTYLAMNRNEFGAVDLGSQELKNATREIKIYKILKNGSPGITQTARQAGQTVGTDAGNFSGRKKLIAGIVAGILLIAITGVIFKKITRPRQTPAAPVVENPQAALPVAKPSEVATIDHIANRQVASIATADIVAQPLSRKETRMELAADRRLARQVRKLPGDGGRQTLLEVDSSSPRLPLDEAGRKTLSEIQQMKADSRIDQAIPVARKMLQEAGPDKKLVWALVLSELLWVNNQKEMAEKIFQEIKKKESSLPKRAQRNLKEQIELIRLR